MRQQVFEKIVDTNLKRAIVNKPLPLDRLIVALVAAGSDLVGPVAAQVSRTVMRSRLAKLGKRERGVDTIPWRGPVWAPQRDDLLQLQGRSDP